MQNTDHSVLGIDLSASHADPLLPTTPQTKASGGGERDRTDDILLAKQALSQLSYTPICDAPTS